MFKTAFIFLWGLFNKKEIEQYVEQTHSKIKIFIIMKNTDDPWNYFFVLLTEHGDLLSVEMREDYHSYYQSIKPMLHELYGSFYELINVNGDEPLPVEVKKAKKLYKKKTSSIVYMFKNLIQEFKTLFKK